MEMVADCAERLVVHQFDGGGHDPAAYQRGHGVDRCLDIGEHRQKRGGTGGFGISRSVIRVMMASVPSDPTSNCVRSYPTTFFTAFDPV